MPTNNDTLMAARACHEAGDLAEAAQIYRQIIDADPNNFDAWHLLGVLASQCGRQHEAVKCIEKALDLCPNHAEAHSNLGLVLKDLGELDRAVARCSRAVQLCPQSAQIHYNLGSVFQQQDASDRAAKCYLRAIELQPDHSDAYNNLGLVRREQGRFDEAAACFQQALNLNPSSFQAHMNLGNLSLLRGEFDQGWQEYEWRWKPGLLPPRDFGRPRWNGEDVKGKTVLLYGEQGLGDTIQFIRYAAMVNDLGATVMIEEQARMLPLLSSCRGIDRLVAGGNRLPAVDFVSPLLSLPQIFQTTVETIPARVPYLFSDSTLISQWHNMLRSVKGFRIGINRAGRSDPGPHKQRDIPPEHFLGLGAVPGVRLISLQKGGGDPLLALRAGGVDFGEELDTQHGAFMDTAAIMMNLDLVITSDTSVAHLAGALGVPVWVALPFVPDWRWMLDRSDSPWYPTMRLFRQKSRGDWAGVFQEIEAALREQVRSRQE
jgi:Tfp pilus assembly protein PilF